MNATWFADGPIRYNPEIGLPEYHIISLEHDYCNGVFHYTHHPQIRPECDFSCLLGMVNLKRAIGFHLVQSYIPTALIVAISWVSFWIDRRAVPARVSLSFTTLLTLSTQGNGIRYALPPVSYAKAIDYFYGAFFSVYAVHIWCLIGICHGEQLHEARANKYNTMAEKLQAGYGHKHAISASEYDSEYDEGPMSLKRQFGKNSTSLMYKALRYSRRALAIDKAARFAFPSVFLLFNVVYWMYYLKEDDNHL
ncbi:Neurotransmitter-gated ion-channel transmembrane region [Cooperia oncophora]